MDYIYWILSIYGFIGCNFGIYQTTKNPEVYIVVFLNHLGGTRQEKTLQQMGDGKVEQLNLLGRKFVSSVR